MTNPSTFPVSHSPALLPPLSHRFIQVLRNYLKIAYLFTYSDFRTTLIPVTAFAYFSTPHTSAHRIVFAGFWTWLHILQFCTANQCVDPEEDALNKPWRPIPAGLISIADARTFHLILLPLCLCLSVWLGPKSSAKWHSISWALAGLAYNGFHFHAHWLTRNVGCAWLYGSLNAGAAIVAAGESGLTTRTAISVAVNSLIIFSTLQSQDFRDLVGDTKTGRWTLPMVWPTGSRISMLVIMTTWSVGLSRACDLAHLFSVPFCMWAAFIGTRFIQKRTPDDDQQTYNYFNMWFVAAQVVHTPMIMTALSHL